MSPNLLQDLKIRKKIEDVRPIAEPSIKKVENSKPIEQPIEQPKEDSSLDTKFASVYETSREKKYNDGGRPRFALWLVALISLGFLFFAFSFLFTSANIIIIPKIQNIKLNQTLPAVKNASSETATLPFDLVVVDGVESKIIQAGEEQDVVIKATGIVIIYNTYSPSSQPLAIDTRLEGSNGKIYKTEKKLTVPGMASDGTPGAIEVGIYASEPGEAYNSEPLDFKILGFKGTPKYSKFYARSKDNLTGGFEGKSSIVSDEEKAKATIELESRLKDKLFKKASDQLPAGFLLFKNASSFTNENVFFSTTDGVTTANLKGSLTGILFEENKLTKKIAENVIPKYDGGEVYIPDIHGLNFSLTNKDTTSLIDTQGITFNLSGPVDMVWRVDEAELANDFLGQKKKDFNQILSTYISIDSAQVTLNPFWKRSFPEKTKDIHIIVNYP